MSEPVLRTQGLHVTYHSRRGSFEALHDVEVQLRPGEILGIVGESGCGKSTLSSAILRLLPPNGRVTGGMIMLDHDDVLRLPENELRRLRGARVGMVFQDPLTSLNPTFRISSQMINAQRAHTTEKVDDRELRRRAVDMLRRVGISDPERRVDDYPHQFSGGMRQRIMVATVLLLRPEVVICDEATSALDVTLQAQILTMVKDLCREQGTAVIIVTHDLGVVASTCDRVAVLYAGRVVEQGSVEETLVHPQHPYTRRLLAAVPSRHRRHEPLATIPGQVPAFSALPPGCTFAPRCPAARPACEAAEPPLLTVGSQQVRCLVEVRDATTPTPPEVSPVPSARAQAVASTESLLVVSGLHSHYTPARGLIGVLLGRQPETVRAVDGVDLHVKRGEIVGLVGESGSGKTTLGKSLLNMAPLTAGSVEFDGVPLTSLGKAGWRRMRRRTQMIFQETYGSLSPRLRVEQLVTEPYRIHRTPMVDRYRVDELLAMVGLSGEQATKYPHELSGGQARRVGIARALAVRPDLIIADEPTSGLDVSAAASVLNLLQDLRERLGLTLVLITHDLNMVGYVADRVAVMTNGRIVELGATGAVMDDPQHPYTKSLLASIPELPANAWTETAPRTDPASR